MFCDHCSRLGKNGAGSVLTHDVCAVLTKSWPVSRSFQPASSDHNHTPAKQACRTGIRPRILTAADDPLLAALLTCMPGLPALRRAGRCTWLRPCTSGREHGLPADGAHKWPVRPGGPTSGRHLSHAPGAPGWPWRCVPPCDGWTIEPWDQLSGWGPGLRWAAGLILSPCTWP